MRRVVSAAPNAAVVATTGCSSVVTSAGLSFLSPSPLGTASNSGVIAKMLSQPSPSVAVTRSALSMASFSTVTPARLQRSRGGSGASIDPLYDREGYTDFSRGGRGEERSSAYNNNTSMNSRKTEAGFGGEGQRQRGGAREVDNNDRVNRLSSSHAAMSPRKSSLPPPPARFKKLVDQHNREESARFVKREQYTRIYEFLKGLRKSTTAADTWQASVAALKDAASRGTPMTSDLVAEAIESCYAAKQYETANELFYSFHFNFNLARGPKAALAFLRVCAATGQFEAAMRVVEWIGGGGLDAATDSQDASSSRPLLSEREDEMDTSSSAPTTASSSSSPSDDGHVEDVLGGGGASVDDGSNENLKLETLWMKQEELKSAAATEKRSNSGNMSPKQSAARTTYPPSLSPSFALTAEMMTLFLRSAAAVANTDKDLYVHHVYPRALQTYQRLRLSHRNARTIITNPLLVEALVQLHAKAQRWEPAYLLLLKTVRLLAVDSSRSGGGDRSFSSLPLGEEGVTPQARRLRKLVSCDADEEVVADGAARDAKALFSQTNTSSSLGRDDAEEQEHDALLSDGSPRGNIKMSESALDDILVRFGVKRSAETHEKKDKAEEEDEDNGTKDWSVTLNEKSSLDDLLAEAEEAEMLMEGMRKGGGLVGNTDADRKKEAMVRLQQELKEMSAEVRSFSEVELSSGKRDGGVASLNISGNKSNANTPYTGPLPSNITYITQGTFDAVIRVCFSAKKFLQTFKTAQLAISLGPAASNNYAPDEASARMLIFSIEEVTAAIYQAIGGNVPALQMQREYLDFCAKERSRIRQKLVDEKTAVRDASYGALKKQGLLLTATSPSSSSSKLKGLAGEESYHSSEDVLPPVTVSEVELLMALPDEVVSSSIDLLTRLSAWKLSKQLFYGLADKGFPLFPQTYESPFRTFIAAGEIESAAEMINEMRKDGRVVPSYCYERLVCERIAHEPVSKGAEGMFEKTLKTLTDVRFSPAAYNSLLRHALAVDNQRLFKNTSRQMLNLEVVEDKEKLLLTIRSRMAANNVIGALAAFSRLNNILSHEARRTAKETDHRVYTSDFFLPQPLIRQLLEAADSYVSSQEKRKARVHQIGGGDLNESGGNDGAHDKFVPFSTLQDTKALPEYWNAERERNLEMAKVVQKALAVRIESGFEGQYLGRDVKQIAAAAAEEKGRKDTTRGGSSSERNGSGQPSSATAARTKRSHHYHRGADHGVVKDSSASSSFQAGSSRSSAKERTSASMDKARPSSNPTQEESEEEEGVPLPPDEVPASSSPSSTTQSKKAKTPIDSW